MSKPQPHGAPIRMNSKTSAATLAATDAGPASEGSRREFEVIALVGFAHGVSHFFHLLLAPLFPWLMRDFSLSYTEIGATMTLFFVISGIGQALAGFAVDRFGALRVLMFGVNCLGLAALTLAGAQSYAGLFMAAGLAGVGNSVFHPADFTVLNRNVSGGRLGHAFSVHGLTGYLGWAAAPVFLTGIAALAGWRVAALGASCVAAVSLGLLFWRRSHLNDGAPRGQTKAGEGAHSTFAYLKVSAVWLCFAIFLLTTSAFGAFQNFGSPVLHHVYGLTLGVAATALTAFLLGGSAGMAVGGFLAGRGPQHDRRIALALSGGAVLALVLASGAVPEAAVLPFMALVGFSNGLAGPSIPRAGSTTAIGPGLT